MFSIRHYIYTLCQNAAGKILKKTYESYDIYILVWEVLLSKPYYEYLSHQHDWIFEQIEFIEKYKHHRMPNEEHHRLEMKNLKYQNQNLLIYHKFLSWQNHPIKINLIQKWGLGIWHVGFF